MIAQVEVDVALTRPPTADATRLFVIVADSETETQLIACQMACFGSVMPVASRIVNLIEF